MQSLNVPQGDRNPQGFTEAQIISALKAETGSRRFSFRYERLSSGNVKLNDLDNVLSAKIEQNWLADIKAKATFNMVSQGDIDFLSDRIKPWMRLHLPPYGALDYVDWPQGVYLLSTPTRKTDDSDSVYRDVEGYDQCQIFLDDKTTDRYAVGSIKENFEALVADGLRTTGVSQSTATTPDAAALDLTGDMTLMGKIKRSSWVMSADEFVCSKYTTTGNQRGMRMGISSTGRLLFTISSDGTAATLLNYTSSVPPVPNTSGELYFKIEFDADDGAEKSVATFYTAPEFAGPYTQLGTPHNTNANTSVFANTASFMAGSHSGGTTNVWNGTIQKLIWKSGISSPTTVLDVDFTAQTVGDDSFTDDTARVWTVQSAASIASTADPIQFVGTWSPTTSQAFRGTYSFTNKDIGNSQTSSTSITLAAGTHTMNLAYKVSTQAGDNFRLLFDGVQEASVSGESDWSSVSFDVTGVTTVTFELVKDASGSAGSDSAWIDDLTLVGGVKYTDKISSLLGSTVSKNITTSTRTIPVVREWDPGTPKLTIINDLLSALNYESLSFDQDGVAIVQPYVSPADRAAEFTYVDDELSVMYPVVDQELDLFSIPNRWVLVLSDPDRSSFKSVYTNTDPGSPTSTVRRGRIIVDFRTEQDAADQATLDAKVQRLAFEASQIYEAISFTTGIMPMHAGNDVYNISYDPLAINSKYAEHTWSMDFKEGATMQHRARRVVTI